MSETPLLVERRREALKERLGLLAGRAESALRQSLQALREGDLKLAAAIVAGDAPIDAERRSLEQEALVTLAAYQPAGVDLRTIGATFEMVAELERIADYATGVASILLRPGLPPLPPELVGRILPMGEAAAQMLAEAMDAYARGADESLARAAAARDDAVDAWQREAVEAIVVLIRERPALAEAGMALSWIAHTYERAADRATNLAERVVYIATGETPDLD